MWLLGPEHDWSSNAADAFGYMAIAYEEPPVKSMTIRRSSQPRARSPFTPGHHQASESPWVGSSGISEGGVNTSIDCVGGRP